MSFLALKKATFFFPDCKFKYTLSPSSLAPLDHLNIGHKLGTVQQGKEEGLGNGISPTISCGGTGLTYLHLTTHQDICTMCAKG
jgi:hypothetical protein